MTCQVSDPALRDLAQHVGQHTVQRTWRAAQVEGFDEPAAVADLAAGTCAHEAVQLSVTVASALPAEPEAAERIELAFGCEGDPYKTVDVRDAADRQDDYTLGAQVRPRAGNPLAFGHPPATSTRCRTVLV